MQEQAEKANANPGQAKNFDAVIIGAGFAGLYMLYRLRNQGLKCRVYEAGSGLGGTWFWNRYPGARCDVESIEYSYSFSDELQQEWKWSERYPSQPEILRYANYVADKFNLKPDIQFETKVTSATYDEAAKRWQIETNQGEQISAQFCVMATGCLSTSQVPKYPGLDNFKGKTYHTGHWPHEGVDFSGQRVAVIGTGSSAIQSIPVIAEQAEQLFVFQRTANFSIPANNKPLDPEYSRQIKENYAELRQKARTSGFGIAAFPINEKSALEVDNEERQREYEKYWSLGGLSFMTSFGDLILNKESNDTAAAFFRDKIRQIVHDPEVAEDLIPKDYPIATKRLCVDTNYYNTFNRENVTLINLKKRPIEEITANGIRTAEREYEVDAIVFATGFDAMTGTLVNMNIRGKGDLSLKEQWAAGPNTYLGLAMAGFPNLFTITGPGSPSVMSNMMVSIEQHVDWIADCVAYVRQQDVEAIEASPEAQEGWTSHVNEVANMTLFPLANSWYMGANIPGKARVYMPYIGGVGAYRQKCDEVAANGYEGFELVGQKVAL